MSKFSIVVSHSHHMSDWNFHKAITENIVETFHSLRPTDWFQYSR